MRLEHGALLDVQLEVGGRALERRARVERRVEVDAVLAQRVGQRRPVAVGQAADGVGLQRAGGRARAQQAAPEARALLVGPADELERQRPRLGRLRAQHLEAGEDVEDPVEPPAVGHRIQVPADDDEALGVARRGGPEVAGRVALDADAVDGGELVAEPVVGRLPGVGPRDALGAVVVAGQALELAQVRNDSARVDRCHAGNLTPRGRGRPGSASSQLLPRLLPGGAPSLPACLRRLPPPRTPTSSAIACAHVPAGSRSSAAASSPPRWPPSRSPSGRSRRAARSAARRRPTRRQTTSGQSDTATTASVDVGRRRLERCSRAADRLVLVEPELLVEPGAPPRPSRRASPRPAACSPPPSTTTCSGSRAARPARSRCSSRASPWASA